MRSAEQAAIERIGPAMIGALDASLKMALTSTADARAAMAANVEKGVNLPRRIARHNDAFSRDFAQNVISGAGDLRFATGIDPHLRIEPVHLLGTDLRVGVVASGKCGWRGRNFNLHGLSD